MVHLLASLTWDPGIRGILVVVLAVAVLCGTPLILLITNLGSRLAIHVAATAIFGWLTLMCLFWAIYALGYHGPAPSWNVLDVSNTPGAARNSQLHNVPQPSDLPKTPAQYVASNPTVAKALKGRPGEPTMGDVIAADPTIAKELQSKLNGWEIVSAANGTFGDTSTAVGNYLQQNGFDGENFDSSSSYVVTSVYQKGGKPQRQNDSVGQRIANRIETTAMMLVGDNPAHYAVVQVRPTIPQKALPGEPPPQAVPDPNQPVINVLLVRNLGAVRQPAFAFGTLSLVIFLILVYSLHRRDKEGMANRRAAELAESGV